MILDNQTLLSNRQAITASAASTNVIDLGPINQGMRRDIGPGTAIPLVAQVTADFAAAGAATLSLALQVDDNSGFTSPKTVHTTAAVPVADLKAGYQMPLDWVPFGTNERYLRLNYTVSTGPFTAGTITAGVTTGKNTNG